MTTAEARDDLLGLIGVENPTDAGQPVLDRILRDENAVLQKLWTMLPQWWSQVTAGDRLRPPQSISGITLVNSAASISGGSLASWMVGCTIRLDGDSFDNELTSLTTLARPYLGPSSSTGTATIYHDAITLGTGCVGVIPPVIILGGSELIPLRGQRDLQSFGAGGTYEHPHYQSGERFEDSAVIAQRRDIGTPVGYMVERALAGSPTDLRLRVSPLPDREYVLQYEKRLATPRVTTLDSTVIPMPQDMAESIFLPMLRWQFSTWKHFSSEGMKTEIKGQYDEALQLLSKMKPQPVRLGRVRVRPEEW